MQYDGRPDGRFGLWVGTWNLGSLSGNGVDVREEFRTRMIDMCRLQGVRLRRQGARMMRMRRRRYKLWWFGKGGGVDGMGVMAMEELCEMLVAVRRVSYKVITEVVFEEDVQRFICGLAPQSRRRFEEKQSFMVSCNVSGICILQVI